FLLPLLLLIPVALLASELDNLVRAALSQVQGSEIADLREKLRSAGALEVLEVAIVAIGIQPVVSEWFYRGVVQQGLVAQLGAGRGIALTALLYALALSQGPVGTSCSLLAPILLHIALNASGSLALAFATQVPIPGFNTSGTHTPLQFLLPAAASVALGIALLVRFGGRARPLPHPEATPGNGESAPPR